MTGHPWCEGATVLLIYWFTVSVAVCVYLSLDTPCKVPKRKSRIQITFLTLLLCVCPQYETRE